MPAPWGGRPPAFPVQPVPHVGDRAITLRQLRELRDFVQRLCKTGLLRFPSKSPYKDDGRAGRRIEWAEITQYEICSEVIKKVIPKEDGFSCSWAELVAGGAPQRRRYFCSHFWGECFRDFVATVEGHAREHGTKLNDTYWICVYGNNQWQVNLGDTLAGSPFYQALRQAEATVVFLDRRAEALQRLWCIFEMHETAVTLKQALQLWTPLGSVGSPLVSSGPAVQALRSLDATRAVASDEFDQRRIRNYIAGKDELAGIGKQRTLRPLYDATPAPGQAASGCAPAARGYEEGLLQACGSKFRALEESIRRGALAAIPAQQERRAGCAIADVGQRGITLAQLRAFAVEVQELLAKDALQVPGPGGAAQASAEWETLEFHGLRRALIEPRTLARGCSYVELLASGAQRPSYSVSMWWGLPFKQFMEALEWHAEARRLPDSTTYWVGLFAFSFAQARDKSTVAAERVQDMCFYRVIRDDPASVDGVVMVLDDDAIIANRLWPMLEAFLGIKHGKSFDLLTPRGALATTAPFANGGWAQGAFDAAVAKRILDFDVLRCRAVVKANRDMILRFIAGLDADSQAEPPAQCEAYETFNHRFRLKSAGPVLREAAFKGDLGCIDWVVEACPGILLGDPSLRGELGETALHVATAAGQTAAMQHLLQLRSDASVVDAHGETPLHYAAFAGQAGAAQLLLAHGADAGARSAAPARETGLDVARQNSAYFLGVQTDDVARVLKDPGGGAASPALPDAALRPSGPQVTRELPAKSLPPQLPAARKAFDVEWEKERTRLEKAWADIRPEEEEVEQLMTKLATTLQPQPAPVPAAVPAAGPPPPLQRRSDVPRPPVPSQEISPQASPSSAEISPQVLLTSRVSCKARASRAGFQEAAASYSFKAAQEPASDPGDSVCAVLAPAPASPEAHGRGAALNPYELAVAAAAAARLDAAASPEDHGPKAAPNPYELAVAAAAAAAPLDEAASTGHEAALLSDEIAHDKVASAPGSSSGYDASLASLAEAGAASDSASVVGEFQEFRQEIEHTDRGCRAACQLPPEAPEAAEAVEAESAEEAAEVEQGLLITEDAGEKQRSPLTQRLSARRRPHLALIADKDKEEEERHPHEEDARRRAEAEALLVEEAARRRRVEEELADRAERQRAALVQKLAARRKARGSAREREEGRGSEEERAREEEEARRRAEAEAAAEAREAAKLQALMLQQEEELRRKAEAEHRRRAEAEAKAAAHEELVMFQEQAREEERQRRGSGAPGAPAGHAVLVKNTFLDLDDARGDLGEREEQAKALETLLKIIRDWGEKRGSYLVSLKDLRTWLVLLGCENLFGDRLDALIAAYLEQREHGTKEATALAAKSTSGKAEPPGPQVDLRDFVHWVCRKGA